MVRGNEYFALHFVQYKVLILILYKSEGGFSTCRGENSINPFLENFPNFLVLTTLLSRERSTVCNTQFDILHTLLSLLERSVKITSDPPAAAA